MKPEFHPDYVSPKLNPLASVTTEFDLQSVERALGESIMDDDDAYKQRSAAFVRAVFTWVTDVNLDSRKAQDIIGRRFIALAWVFDPGLFDGESAAALASKLKIKSVARFQKLTGEASRHFNIRNRAQDHGWNSGLSNAAATTTNDNSSNHDKTAKRGKSRLMADMTPATVKESFKKPRRRAGSKKRPTV